MWPLKPGLDNQKKLVFTFLVIGCVQVGDTLLLRSLDKVS